MADKQTIKGAILTMNPKIVLAFFLIVLAAALFIFFAVLLASKPNLDAGTVALLAGFVTTFTLMAKSASDYQFVSSAGSDKKDDAQTAVSKALAEKVPAPASPAPTTGAVVVAWWGSLDADEQQALRDAAVTDPKVAAFNEAAKTGRATPDDLAYLVSKVPPLLSQAKADFLKTL